MLADIEKKLTAILGDGLVARTHVQVVEAAGRAAPAAGKEVVTVSLPSMSSEAGFDREQARISPVNGGSASVQRILPLRFVAQIDFVIRPQDANITSINAARALLLDDVSLSAHLLAGEPVNDGRAFQTAAPDPGFEVLSFAFSTGTVSDILDGTISAQLLYSGVAGIWPVGVSQSQGTIVAVDPTLIALPIQTATDLPSVVAGTGTNVRIRSVNGQRLSNASTQARSPLQLAVTVVSDLPMGQRGTITSGNPGAETGLRIVTTADPETVVNYQAPAVNNLGNTRVEFIAIHIATPDGHSGVFLGSAAVALVPGAGA